jgi:hypothetical protein
VADVWGNASVTFDNTILENNSAAFGGALISEGSAIVRFTRCSVRRCAANDAGGAIAMQDQALVNMTRCIISKCSAGNLNGGAISAIDNGSIYLEHCRLQHNTAKVRGGAIAVDDHAHLHAVKTSILDNSAISGGGVTGFGGSYVTLSQCLLFGNSARQGGGMTVGGNSTLRMSKTEVAGNSASIAGGGIYFEGGEYVLSQVLASVHNNKAPLVGDTVILPDKLTAIGTASFVDNFVSRLGADDGMLNVTLLASGRQGVPCPGMDVMAALVEHDDKLYVLTTQKTGNDGKVQMRLASSLGGPQVCSSPCLWGISVQCPEARP